jgi:hypothetical protein
MKKKYSTSRDTRGIITKQINNEAMQLGAKILSFKLLIKFHREEVPVGVVAFASQFTEGTSMI